MFSHFVPSISVKLAGALKRSIFTYGQRVHEFIDERRSEPNMVVATHRTSYRGLHRSGHELDLSVELT